MFAYEDAFNADISKWKTGKVTDMSQSTSTSFVPYFLFVECVTDLLLCVIAFHFSDGDQCFFGLMHLMPIFPSGRQDG